MPLSNFSAEDWDRLTNAERISQCRRMAEEARRLAATATAEIHRSYLELAQNWDQLGAEIEKIKK